MDLRTFGRTLWRHAILIIALTIIGVYTGLWVASLAPATYTATSQVVVSAMPSDDTFAQNQSAAFILNRVETYAEMATGSAVLRPVYAEIGDGMSYDEFAASVSSSVKNDTTLITIEVTTPSHDLSEQAATMVSDSLIATVTKLELPPGVQRSQVVLTRTGDTTVPAKPTSVPVELFAVAGGAIGLGIGVAIALARAGNIKRVRTRSDLARLGLGVPVLGSLASVGKPGLAMTNGASPEGRLSQSARTLRAVTAALAPEAGTFVVTSGRSREGVTVTASRLAVSFAEVGRTVVLVDANLWAPAAHTTLRKMPSPGLGDVLSGRTPVGSALQPTSLPTLWLLAGGFAYGNASDLLGGPEAVELMAELAEQFDYVFVDAPALLEQADALNLGRSANAVLLVTSAGKTKRVDLERSVELIAEAQLPPAGIVLNRERRRLSAIIGAAWAGLFGGFRGSPAAVPTPTPAPAHTAGNDQVLTTLSRSSSRSGS